MEGNTDVGTTDIPSTSSKKQSEENLKSENEKTTSAFLYFAATVANFNYLTLGITIIWISPVTSKLQSYNSEENPLGRPVTTLELSLIGSLSQTGMVIGPVLLEKLFDQFGRRSCINVLASLNVICYLVLAFANHIYLYYAMIFLIGIILGGVSVGLSMYISEITEDHNRGSISCYMGSFMPIGNLYGFMLGPFLSVKMFTLLCTLPSVIAIIISEICLPESPQYLINKGRKEDALKSLRKLIEQNNSRVEQVANEIELNTVKTKELNKSCIKLLFTRKSSRNGLIISCVLSSMSAGTGIAPIMSYLEPIFESAQTQISGSICAIFVGVLQIFCYFIASILIEKWGRRPLLLYSAITTTIPLVTVGTYFYLLNAGSPLIQHMKWVPIAGIIMLMITGITGVCSVAVALMNELFSSDIKSTAMSVVYCLSGIITAGSIFLLPIMSETVGLACSFWMFAVICLLGFVYIYFQVPETKGKNITEIQELLAK